MCPTLEMEIKPTELRAGYLARGWRVFAEDIPKSEGRALLGALFALTHDDWGPEFALSLGGDEGEIAEWAEYLLTVCPPEILSEFASATKEVAELGDTVFDDWSAQMSQIADRVALLASGDLGAAMRYGKQRSSEGRHIVVSGPGGFRELLEAVPHLSELHDFAFSPDYQRFFIDMNATMAGYE